MMIVSVGEVVWDVFADRQVLGGAPINVAYHLATLGLEVKIVTRVGSDGLAEETLARLGELGLGLAGVQRDEELATGRVNVTVDERHEPHFDIVAPAAWDNIELAPALELLGSEPFALVFGTLAQRDRRSRATIRSLWERAATRFYDVNLRPPFTTRELVLDSLAAADLVKMNGDELATIGRWAGVEAAEKKMIAEALLSKYTIAALAVTEGADGAWLVAADGFHHHAASPVRVADTVGAGDAFFATLIEGYLRQRPWDEALARANRRGGYVASRPGATPPMPEGGEPD